MIHLTDNIKSSFTPLHHTTKENRIYHINVDVLTNDEILPIVHDKPVYVVNMNSEMKIVISDRLPTTDLHFVDVDGDFRFNLQDDDVIIIMIDIQNFILIRKGG